MSRVPRKVYTIKEYINFEQWTINKFKVLVSINDKPNPREGQTQ